MESTCEWKLYGYGNVAIDKPEGTNIIEVFLKDKLYAAEGEVSEKKDMMLSVNDSEGNIKTEKADVRKTIPARWLAESQPNRMTSPDVRKNETVLIYRYANNDDYYWEKVFTEDKLRGKETVTFAFKNTDDLVEVRLDNSYILHFSTKDKLIQLHTSINDGEKVGYDIILDTGKSTLSVIDTRGNHSTLTSLEDDWKIKTNKTIHLETEDIFLDASRDIIVTAGRDIITRAGRDITFDAGRFMGMSSPAFKTSGKGGGSFELTCATGIMNINDYTTNTTNYNLTSTAGTMSNTSSGYDFTKMLICTDLKTSAVASQNGHKHSHPHGPTGAPLG